MKGSDILVKCLEREGVDRVFGIPGEENLDLMDSLIDSRIEFVLTRHESSAAFMAGMVGRLTGRPGVCLTTLGPGASNMVIGVAEAYLGYYPMVAMSGQVRQECQRAPRKQYIDQVSMFRPITKASLSMTSAESVPEITRRAFDLASEERPGPVFLELPEDVMKQRSDAVPLAVPHNARMAVDASGVERMRELLTSAQRPVVLAGHGVVRARASEELRRFVERWNVPAAMTWLGAGSLPFDHTLSLGTVGLRRADMMRAAFEAADLVVLVGFDLMEFEPQYWNIGATKGVAYIGAAPCDAVPGFAPELHIVGDIRSVLASLGGPPRGGAAWTAELKVRLMDMLAAVPEQDGAVKPQAIVKAIRDSLGREDICVSDVGAHLIWMAQRYPVYKENTLLMSNGLIPMGVGIPWAIAAKLTHPDRKVVASVGDGSFAMTGMELLTAKELGTPFVTVVWNDAQYRLIRAKQDANFGRSTGVEFTNPDFAEMARSMGIDGIHVSSAIDLAEAINEGLNKDELVLIEVAIDNGEPMRFG